jgi:hypothetical protein
MVHDLLGAPNFTPTWEGHTSNGVLKKKSPEEKRPNTPTSDKN